MIIHVISATLLVLVALGILLMLKVYLTLKAKAIRQYRRSANAFFEKAKPLLSDEEVPDSLRDHVYFLSESIDDPDTVYLALHVIRNGKGKRVPSPAQKQSREFFARRPELEKAYHDAILSWFIAITAMRPIVGAACRAIMFNDADRVERTASRVVKTRSKSRNHDDLGTGTGTGTAVALHS